MPASSDAAKLDKYSEDLLALGLLGYEFAKFAAGKLVFHHNVSTDTHYWMLVSAFNRRDIHRARQFLKDWKSRDSLPSATISRFIPGDHWHVLGTKFYTMEEARDYLRSRGYKLGGIIEKHVYAGVGD